MFATFYLGALVLYDIRQEHLCIKQVDSDRNGYAERYYNRVQRCGITLEDGKMIGQFID